ncbi:MAG: DUF167 domain-containing protein [Deltaproteobacteria bacterium]|nr:DUF167 domain-containing protein [Deltaproteobacteria bacterium]
METGQKNHENIIKIKLLPRSSINQVTGKQDGVYRIKVTAPPVDGKANNALINLLAKRLRRPKRDIEIVSGKGSRLKSVRIYGLSSEMISQLMDDAKD